MVKKVVLAISQREYAAKLAEYLREEEREWDIVAYTQSGVLRKELQSGGRVDALIGQPDLIGDAAGAPGIAVGKFVVLTEGTGGTEEGREKGWLEIEQYQPLPALLSEIRGALGSESPGRTEGCRVWTVFSASGGTGKTAVALNLARQAGERGLKVFYLNLETLNATSLLFGKGEPDGLSRLLYALQTRPEQWDGLMKRHIRHQPQLRADYLDAPEHPGELLALTPELAAAFLDKLKDSGRYDVILADPDSGCGEWHRRLLEKSDRVVWLTADDAQALSKAEKLLAYWRESFEQSAARFVFAVNKANGGRLANRWGLPGAAPSATLPYIPQWKAVDQPGRLLGMPAFAGAVEVLLNLLEPGADKEKAGRGRRREGHAAERRAYDWGVG